MPSLQDMVDNNVISIGMARKMASSNLNKSALQLAYSRGQDEGIRQVFSEECGKGPRVTRSAKIITAVSNYISEHINET